jgi:hypothetical protein
MKQYCLLLAGWIGLSSGNPATAQTRLYGQLGGGLTLPLKNAISAGQLGLYAERPLDGLLWLGGGLSYRYQSFSVQEGVDKQTGSVHTIQLHDVRLPVMLSYRFSHQKSAVVVYGGLSLSSRIRAADKYTIRYVPLGDVIEERRSTSAGNELALQALAGARFAISSKGRIFVEYQQDLTLQKLQSAGNTFYTRTALVGIEWIFKQ